MNGWWVIAQTSSWLLHTQTHRQTDAGNDNTRRPKLASGKNYLENCALRTQLCKIKVRSEFLSSWNMEYKNVQLFWTFMPQTVCKHHPNHLVQTTELGLWLIKTIWSFFYMLSPDLLFAKFHYAGFDIKGSRGAKCSLIDPRLLSVVATFLLPIQNQICNTFPICSCNGHLCS